METKPMSVWIPFGFSAVLSAIVMTGNIAGAFLTGRADAGMIALVGFLPMAFWFAAASHRQTREYVITLEARVRQLEGGNAA
jgi:hypothetical protein